MTRTPTLILILLTVLIGTAVSPSFAAEQKMPPVVVAPQVTERDLLHAKEILSKDLNNHDKSDELRINSIEKDMAAQDKLNQKRLDGFSDRLTQQSTRIADFQTYVGWFIGLLGVGVAGASVFTFKRAKIEAHAEIGNWLNNEGAKVLDKYVQEEASKRMSLHDERFKNIELQIRKQADESLAKLNQEFSEALHDGKKGAVSQEQMDELNEFVEDIKKQSEMNRSFNEWFAIGSKYYWDGRYKKSANALQIAIELEGITDLEKTDAMINLGAALDGDKQYKAAIAAYDEVERRYLDAGDEELLKQVSVAQGNRSFSRITLAKERLVNGEDAQGLLSTALADAEAALKIKPKDCIALGNKGYALFLLGKTDEAEDVFKLAFECVMRHFMKAPSKMLAFIQFPKTRLLFRWLNVCGKQKKLGVMLCLLSPHRPLNSSGWAKT